MNDPELLTIGQVQERLKVGRTTVYALLESGELRGVKVRAARRVYNQDLEDYMTSLVAETDGVTCSALDEVASDT